MTADDEPASLWQVPAPTPEEMEAAQVEFARIEATIATLTERFRAGTGGAPDVHEYAALKAAFERLLVSPAFLFAFDCTCGHDIRNHWGFRRPLGPYCWSCLDIDEPGLSIGRCALEQKPS